MVKQKTKQRRVEEDAIAAVEDEDHQSNSDSDAPEEESNAAGRRNLKGLDKSRQSAQRRALTVKKSVAPAQDEIAEVEDPTEALSGHSKTSSSGIAEASTLNTDTSHRLDPALFAESFAKKSAVRIDKKKDGRQSVASSLKSAKKHRKLALGRDGQPMKRLKDGRTTVRVLPKPTRLDDLDDNADVKAKSEETITQPISIDPTEILPNANVRAFKKRKLRLKDSERLTSKGAALRSLRTEDDPLGLEDPAFMKGGEFVKADTAKKVNVSRSKPNPPKGRRTKFTPAMSKHSQALHFARSL